MQSVSAMLGKVVDCYHIQAVLGKGGMGVVYKALDTSLDKVVALKVMNPLLVEDERFMRRFKSEAKALGRLQHPNVVSVFALRQVEHHVFIVMEYVDGPTVADLIRQRGPISWQHALPILQQTLGAIDYAHQEKIIHRDIKPHNILLTGDGVAKVTDFGLAKIQAAHSDSAVATKAGFTGGTLYYMPPEQLEGLPNVDHRGDIYGLGMTYYEMLAGRTPFDKLSSEFAILKAIDAHDIPPLDELNEDVPEPLARIVMKALERYPDDRYQTAGEMLRAMAQWQAGAAPVATGAEQPAAPPPSTPPTDAPPPASASRRRPDTPLESLKAVLAQYFPARPTGEDAGKQDAPSTQKTIVTKAPPKAAPPPPKPPPPKPPPPKPPPDAQRGPGAETPASTPARPAPPPERKATPPAPEAAPGAFRQIRQRPVLAVGAAVALLLLGFLLYLGTRQIWRSPAVDGLAADAGAAVDSGEAMIPGETALLSIRTRPVEALVFVDGRRVGSTPLIDYEIGTGTRTLRIEKTGYLPLDTSITLGLNQTPSFTFSLREDTPAPAAADAGTLVVRSEPTGATVWLDGRSAGQTPLTMRDLKPGTHRLVLRKAGFQDYTRSVSVAARHDNLVRATLTALRSTLKISVRPFGDIYVDGGLKAQRTEVPYTQDVGTGVYRVRVMHPEYGTWDKQVRVDSSGTREVLFNFEQQFEVSVTSEPDRAEILVDGRPTGTFTPGVVRLRPGQRTIGLRRSGYVMEGSAQVLTLERNWTDPPLHFTLRKIQ